MEFWKRNRIQNPTVMDLLAFMKFAALAEVRHLPSFPPSPSPFPTDRDNRKTKQGAITCICGRHARASLSSYAGGIFSRSRRVPFKIGGLLCRPSSLPFQMLRPKCRQIPRGKLSKYPRSVGVYKSFPWRTRMTKSLLALGQPWSIFLRQQTWSRRIWFFKLSEHGT